MNNNTELDELMLKSGEVVKNESIIKNNEYKDKVINALDNEYANTYAYGDIGPIPGTPVEMNTGVSIDNTEDERKAGNRRLIAAAAQMKLRKEMEEFNKKSDKEKIRTYVISALMQQQEREYLEKHHYVMSGDIKRRTRKSIERQYDKGRIRLTKEEKDNILYNLSLSSNQKSPVNTPQTTNQAGGAAQMRNLVSSI